MSKPFQPNHRGLVVVKLTKNYASNVAGESAGFLPSIAKELVKKGYAVLPGQEAPAQPEAAQGGAEITTRKFNPQRDPLDHDGDGKKGGSVPDDQRVVPGSATDSLRKEFKELTGKEPDSRWGAARLAAEIEKAMEAATSPDDAAAQPDAAQGDE